MIAVSLVLQQLLLMAVLISISWLLTKKQRLTIEGARQMSTILLYVVVPALIVTSFQRPWSLNEFYGLLLAVVAAVLYHLLGIFIINLRKPASYDGMIFRLAVVYSNCGFMAFPILNALYGSEGIFYGGVFVAVFNIFLWSHGISGFQLSPEKSVKKILLNPGVLPVIIGVVLFGLQITLPPAVLNLLKGLAAVNTPLAMFVIGIYLAPVAFASLWKNPRIRQTTVLRLLLLPLIFYFSSRYLLQLSGLAADQPILEIITICGACPAASSIILIPSSLGKSGELGAELVLFTTVCSVLTIPMIVYLIQLLSV